MSAKPEHESSNIVHGYPHLRIIKDSLKALYCHLPQEKIHSFFPSFAPEKAVLPENCDLIIAVQRLAGAIVSHFKLPTGCIIVKFRKLNTPGRVELTNEDNYIVDLSSKYENDFQDIPAILAHEISHVFLHRHGIRFPETFENEILTDTTAVYLVVGWLALNAYRVTTRQEKRREFFQTEIRTETKEEKLGYLTPEEFGYVLGKRAFAFGEKVDRLITSPAAKQALQAGSQQARLDHHSPPLSKCAVWQKLKYIYYQRYVRNTGLQSGLKGLSRSFGGYQFEFGDSLKVIFDCPVCGQKLRLPTQKKLQARCTTCGSFLDCRT